MTQWVTEIVINHICNLLVYDLKNKSKTWVCRYSIAEGSNSVGGMDASFFWTLRVIKGLCNGPIPRPEESYQVCVSMSVIRCNNNPLHLQRVGRKGQNKKEREKESQ
jgi:hypothetical protein